MKTIKKTTLIAAITAMTALAVPAMASAAVWGPINTNQSLDSPSAVSYAEAIPAAFGTWTCTGQHLGVHVRTPASSTLDITSASWTGCSGTGSSATCGAMTITPTGLPWTATGSTGSASFQVHAQMHWNTGSACGSTVVNLDGTVSGTWNAATHTFTLTATSTLTESYMGTFVASVRESGAWRNPTQVLTLA